MSFETLIFIYVLVLSFVCGACAGSFVNCAADRTVAKESVFSGRSHCPACGHVLSALDLFPILSYLFLRGKCRHCGAKIPVRCLFTECLGALMFTAAAAKFGVSLVSIEICLLFAALLALSLVDLDIMEIPDGIHGFLLIVFFAFLPFHGALKDCLIEGLIGAAVFGGGMLLLSLLLDFLLKKESLGGGDIKLFAVLGLYLGPWKGLVMLLLSCLIGLCFYASRHAKGMKSQEFPFGPSIALAAGISVLVGEEIIRLYLNLIL